MNKCQISISVIIPVYNSEKYIEQTIQTLQNQTYANFEVICVDDGSTDRSVMALQKSVEKDERFHVIQMGHKGAASARNLGLSKSEGTFVLFLDSDDFFEPTLLEKAVGKACRTNADVVLFGAKRYDQRTASVKHDPSYLRKHLLPKQEVFNRRDMAGQLLNLTNPPPWTKVFRRQFLLDKNIRFQKLENSNDVCFVFLAMAEAERIAAVCEDLVYYRVFRDGSLQDRKSKHPFCFLDAYEETYHELHSRGLYAEVEQGFCDRALSGCLYNMDSAKTEKQKWAIARVLCSSRFYKMGLLDHPEENYFMRQDFQRMKGLPFAIKAREILEKELPVASITPVRRTQKRAGIKVSVVVPVHNTEDYLAETIESILRQSLEEIEVICIDDGSDDASLDILCKYADGDKRVVVYRQENCGLSATRNQGMERAKGEYLYFLDSDDALESCALEELYTYGKTYDLDILYFDGETVYEDEKLKEIYPEYCYYYRRSGDYQGVYQGKELMQAMRSQEDYRVNAATQFYKRKFLIENHLSFYPGIIHEDNAFTFMSAFLAERVGYLKKTFYRRRIRPSSIITIQAGFSHVYGYFKNYQLMLRFLQKQDYPAEMTETLYSILNGVFRNIQDRYHALSEAEKHAFDGLKGTDRIEFRLYIEANAQMYGKMVRAVEQRQEKQRILQRTYDEKFDRGVEIKRLKKQIASIKKSRTYRLARLLGAPVRFVRKIKKAWTAP